MPPDERTTDACPPLRGWRGAALEAIYCATDLLMATPPAVTRRRSSLARMMAGVALVAVATWVVAEWARSRRASDLAAHERDLLQWADTYDRQAAEIEEHDAGHGPASPTAAPSLVDSLHAAAVDARRKAGQARRKRLRLERAGRRPWLLFVPDASTGRAPGGTHPPRGRPTSRRPAVGPSPRGCGPTIGRTVDRAQGHPLAGLR